MSRRGGKLEVRGIQAPMRIVPVALSLLTILAPALVAQDLPKQKFNRGSWEDAIGYAQAVRVGDMLHISGSVGSGPMPAALAGALDEIKQSLAAYGLDFRHIVKETIYTTDIEALKAAMEVRKPYYGADFPAATWVQVARLFNPEHVIEIEATAVFPPDAPSAPTRVGAEAPAVANLLREALTALYLTGDETVVDRALHDSYAVLAPEGERIQSITKQMILTGLRRDKAAGKYPTFPGGAFAIDHVETVAMSRWPASAFSRTTCIPAATSSRSTGFPTAGSSWR